MTSAATLPPPDTGSHAAAAKTRANTKAGVGPAFTSDVLLANLETRRVVSAPAVIADRLEFCFGMNSGTASGADGAARRRLPIT